MRKDINELAIGEAISGNYILKSFTVKLTRTGKEYLDLVLQDKTGTIAGKMWDMPSTNLTDFEQGGFVSTTFLVSSYNETLQADVKGLIPIKPEDLTMEEKAELVPVIDEDPETLFDSLITIINSLSNQDYKDLALDILSEQKDAYLSYPGAKSVHHSEIGGLLLHSLEVVKFVQAIYSVTPWFDEELCIIAAALHDICKIKEFTLGATGLVADYSTSGQLLGHIYMGAEYVGTKAKEHGFSEEKIMQLQHIILAHHGKPEFGSVVIPHTMEAEVVHMADDLSAKMHVFKDAVKDVEPGEFSDKIFALDGAKVYNPKK